MNWYVWIRISSTSTSTARAIGLRAHAILHEQRNMGVLLFLHQDVLSKSPGFILLTGINFLLIGFLHVYCYNVKRFDFVVVVVVVEKNTHGGDRNDILGNMQTKYKQLKSKRVNKKDNY